MTTQFEYALMSANDIEAQIPINPIRYYFGSVSRISDGRQGPNRHSESGQIMWRRRAEKRECAG